MTKLLDLCELIVDCEHKTAPKSSDGYPSIRTPNVGRGRLILDGVNRVDEDTYIKWTRRATPAENDLIIAREAPVGNVAIVRKGQKVCLGQRTVLVRPDPNKVDPEFLCYFLLGDYAQNSFLSAATGATVPHLNMSDIRGLSIPALPDRKKQRWIATTLAAYDDLIENNTRRIEILEEMARRLYEEWFVQYHFPGHEGVEFKESELGLIPEGWEVVALEKAVEINPKTKVERDGEKVFVPMGALSESGMVISGWEIKSGNSGAKFQNGDTLVARISPCLENGKTGFVDFLPANQPTACGSTEFIVLRSRSLCPEMVYCLSRSDRFREVAMKSMSGATGRQRVRVESLVGYPIAQPENELVAKYHAFAQPCFKEIRVLANKNANLRQQRDLLLPKLISGEIDVSDIPMPT
ncbi:restriction endonuclease subunit S [Stutzerimonas azotifigens]|uniref:restriction endonuclease subunit S n=1 Tax=Stutzerimonas azotifigens TaxID=291995 RepID=UPI001267F12E|nr:restriction endonuclease subunit S [Stutzerimonas azotifigens]